LFYEKSNNDRVWEIIVIVITLVAISFVVSAGYREPKECSDGVDNDLDGLIDFPKDTNCESEKDHYESIEHCQDRIDNDKDGFIDYPNDDDCNSENDMSEESLGEKLKNKESVCGDNVCDETEQTTCSQDCSIPTQVNSIVNAVNEIIQEAVSSSICGDGSCNGGETKDSCSQDCVIKAPKCGDNFCEKRESQESCPEDCGVPGSQCGNLECWCLNL